jgi:hypothetical protein
MLMGNFLKVSGLISSVINQKKTMTFILKYCEHNVNSIRMSSKLNTAKKARRITNYNRVNKNYCVKQKENYSKGLILR